MSSVLQSLFCAQLIFVEYGFSSIVRNENFVHILTLLFSTIIFFLNKAVYISALRISLDN